MSVSIEKGSATDARPSKEKGGVIIAHICNNLGAWGRGFVLAVDDLSAAPRAAYMGLAKDHGMSGRGASADIPLGHWQFVETQPGLFICNMIAQKGIKRSDERPCLVDYDALRRCLKATFHRAIRLGYAIHMPSGMGSGLAGGDKATIHKIVEECATEVEQAARKRPGVSDSASIDVTLWEFDDSSARSYVSEPATDMVEDTSDAGDSVIADDDVSELG
jgi:hypothetical protein